MVQSEPGRLLIWWLNAQHDGTFDTEHWRELDLKQLGGGCCFKCIYLPHIIVL